MQSDTGSNVWNTSPADRLGRTRRHLRPRAASISPATRPGRSSRRIRIRRSTAPATASRPSSSRRGWPKGTCSTQEHRHTSLIATLREQWHLGDAFTARDAAARTLLPRIHSGRATGPQIVAGTHPTPSASLHRGRCGPRKGRIRTGQNLPGRTPRARTRERHQTRRLPDDPKADIPPEQIVTLLRSATIYFPQLAPAPAKS